MAGIELKDRSVTCSAPVNIAVIKYCKRNGPHTCCYADVWHVLCLIFRGKKK